MCMLDRPGMLKANLRTKSVSHKYDRLVRLILMSLLIKPHV